MLICEKNQKHKRWKIQNMNHYVAQGSYLLEFSNFLFQRFLINQHLRLKLIYKKSLKQKHLRLKLIYEKSLKQKRWKIKANMNLEPHKIPTSIVIQIPTFAVISIPTCKISHPPFWRHQAVRFQARMSGFWLSGLGKQTWSFGFEYSCSGDKDMKNV